MLTELREIKSNPREWRRFAWVLGPVLLLLGLWLARRHGAGALWCAAAGLSLILLGWIAPSLLRWPHRAWMALGLLLGTIVSSLFLTLFYFLLLTPIGLLARLTGRDFLESKLDRRRSSYWHRRDPDSPREPARYEKQF